MASQSYPFKIKHFIVNGYFLAFIAAFTASFKAIFVKLIYLQSELDAAQLLLLRLSIVLPFFIGMVVYAHFYKPLNQTLISSSDNLATDSTNRIINQLKLIGLLVWAGFCGYYFASLADFIGLQYISAGLERLVLFTYPTLVLLIEAILFKRLPSAKTWGGVFICYLGLCAALGHDIQFQDPTKVWIGVGWVFLSSLSFTFYYLSAGRLIRQLGTMCFTGWIGIIATIFTFIHFALTYQHFNFTQLTIEVWLYITLIALLCTLLPSWLTAASIAKLGASTSANISTLGPIFTIVLSWMILTEPFSWLQLIGLILVLTGIRIVQQQKSQTKS
ncbi:DMT family transporter [Aliikangiella maris]|uniref:DMT family transporter n=2 Tax=Aliikangiella maris TaxID=3162458 RepID=A0ABV2BVS7_9GAMM